MDNRGGAEGLLEELASNDFEDNIVAVISVLTDNF